MSSYYQLLSKTHGDFDTAVLRNGILMKIWVRQSVGYVVLCCKWSILPSSVAGYPMVEVFFVRV